MVMGQSSFLSGEPRLIQPGPTLSARSPWENAVREEWIGLAFDHLSETSCGFAAPVAKQPGLAEWTW
ncbi:hypothetical protein Pan216_03100 [Planctomycetes bacterium Pan216]|uniref:Uncharacterized protein n=1 Tax=Kolteria novifilia TaxID=2527975 RepID=A0A518AXN0_9BACT|nr:hypothetical protein Pan216_03100 [Planctomycetes bacterium Pan216]